MHVLVPYASKRGGTKGLAEMLGAALEEHGPEFEINLAET
jgi:menaquinone-dependent protoporphyrinogen IX oxidase